MHSLRKMLLAAMLCVAVPGAAIAAAPAQLRNKNITVSATLQISQRAPDGRTASPQIQTQHVVYVSNVGRAFLRATRSVGTGTFSGSRVTEVGPGAKRVGQC